MLGGKISTRGTLLGIVGSAIVQSCTDSVEPGTGAIENTSYAYVWLHDADDEDANFLAVIGTLMFGEHAHMDLVRLAIPRRVYTQSHIDYVVEVILEVWKHRHQIRGLKLTYQQPFLRHFTARMEPV